jgi:serine/threonine-protein phosphatase 5
VTGWLQGYYRRGDANLALAKYKPALRDFKKAVRLAPNDPDLKRKITETEKAIQRAAFEKALAGVLPCQVPSAQSELVGRWRA